jgi:hypothetical protein
MNATMRARVWAMHDAGKSNSEIVQTLGISRRQVSMYLERREVKTAAAMRVFCAGVMRGEEIKTAAAGAGVNVNTGWRWLRPLGFLRMYVTAAERQDLIARRRDAERAAMLPEGAAIAGGIALRMVSRAYDSGWVDRGISDWRKDMARRNALGRFRPKQERTQ